MAVAAIANKSIKQERRKLSDNLGNYGHRHLGSTGAAVFQESEELISVKIRNLWSPVAILVKRTVFLLQTLLCNFSKIEVFKGQQIFCKYAAIITFVAVQYTAFERA
jgi:hypothetical protein